METHIVQRNLKTFFDCSLYFLQYKQKEKQSYKLMILC